MIVASVLFCSCQGLINGRRPQIWALFCVEEKLAEHRHYGREGSGKEKGGAAKKYSHVSKLIFLLLFKEKV